MSRVIVCGYWQSPLKQLIYGLKYYRAKPIAKSLGQLLANNARLAGVDKAILVLPVPLHRGRLWDRGFNQSDLLAQEVASQLNLPLKRFLVRKKSTRPQFGLGRSARQDNLAGAFDVLARYSNDVVGQTILLVDDVITTGATLNECAKVLKTKGAREVWGLVLAKA
ncbi:MAG: ComF family protein [Patescibacteria group bacterium]